MYKIAIVLAILLPLSLLSIPAEALQSYSDGASETITLPWNEYFIESVFVYDGGCSNWPQGCASSGSDIWYKWHNNVYLFYWVLVEQDGNENVISGYSWPVRETASKPFSDSVETRIERFVAIPPTNVTFTRNGNYRVELRRIHLNRPTLEHSSFVNLSSRIDSWKYEGGEWFDPSKREPNYIYRVFGCCGYEAMTREYLSQRNIPVTDLAETLDVYEIEINSIEEPAEPVENPFSLESGVGGGKKDEAAEAMPLGAAGIASIALVSSAFLASGSIVRHWRTHAGRQAEDDTKRAYLRIEAERIARENRDRENANRKAAEWREKLLLETREDEAKQRQRTVSLENAMVNVDRMYTYEQKASELERIRKEYADVLSVGGGSMLTSQAVQFREASKAAYEAYSISNSTPTMPVGAGRTKQDNIAENTKNNVRSAVGSAVNAIAEGVKGAFSWLLGGAKQVASSIKKIVESVPVIGKPIADFAHGFGKSIYNSAKFFLWDMPKGAFDWVTTSKDHLGDIKNGAKFVADGISWVVTHPLEAAGTIENLAQQAWNYCTGSAMNAGECTGEIAQMIIPTGAAVSVTKAGKQALSLGKYKNVAEELTEGYFRNPKSLNPSAYTEKVRTRFGEGLRLDGAESILKERGVLAQTNIKTGKVTIANDPFALKNTKQLVLHEVLHSQIDIPKELEKLAINGGGRGFGKEYDRLLAAYINQNFPWLRISESQLPALRGSGKLDALIGHFDETRGNLIEDMLVDKLALKADKKGYSKFLKENLADNLLRWGDMSEFGKAQTYFFAKSLLKDGGMAKKLGTLIEMEGGKAAGSYSSLLEGLSAWASWQTLLSLQLQVALQAMFWEG